MTSAWNIVNRAAPALAALVLGAALYADNMGAQPVSGADAYFGEVRQSIEALPYRVGAWIGSDMEPQKEADRILRPNKILQRRYTHPESGEQVTVLVVHCGDVRDMLGHYPPVCYPAHGWVSESPAPFALPMGDGTVDARRYVFHRTIDTVRIRMDVLGFFVRPALNANVFSDMEALSRASQSPTQRGLGAAQIQLLSVSGSRPLERPEVVREFTRALEPVIETIAAGVRHQEDAR